MSEMTFFSTNVSDYDNGMKNNQSKFSIKNDKSKFYTSINSIEKFKEDNNKHISLVNFYKNDVM